MTLSIPAQQPRNGESFINFWPMNTFTVTKKLMLL